MAGCDISPERIGGRLAGSINIRTGLPVMVRIGRVSNILAGVCRQQMLMHTDQAWQVLPTHKLHKVAERYRLQASTASDEAVREQLLAMAKHYEDRVVQHLIS